MSKDNKEPAGMPAPRGEVLSFPRRISARIRSKDRLLLVSHDRPDGDALGSMVALSLAAAAEGKRVEMICDDLPDRYSFLCRHEQLNMRPSSEFRAAADWADYILVLDTSTLDQLTAVSEALVSYWGKLLVIDHHTCGQDIAPIRWQDSTAAATALLVGELIADCGWPMTLEIAEALLTGICADTGWLRFSNTDRRVMDMAAACVGQGADTDKIYRKLFQSYSPARVKLLARSLNSLDFIEMPQPAASDDEDVPLLAIMSLDQNDFDASGAAASESEDIINAPMRVGRVAVSVLAIENGQGIRLSLRSRPDSGVNVAEIASCFGGGGHVRAAGARVDLPLDTLKSKLIKMIC